MPACTRGRRGEGCLRRGFEGSGCSPRMKRIVPGWGCNTNHRQHDADQDYPALRGNSWVRNVGIVGASDALSILVHLREHGRSRPICSGCMHKRSAYDRLPERRFEFVPLWNIPVRFVYSPRRADCPTCGVVVEAMPWAASKSPITTTYAWFLASWAKVLSWTETARRFRTSWHVVFTAVRHAVEWGKAHRYLDGITAI